MLFHAAGLLVTAVPGKRFVEEMRCLARSFGAGSLEVIAERLLAVRMRAVFDDRFRAFFRRQVAQIRVALFDDDDHDFMLGMIHVRTHRHDGRDRAVLGDRRCRKNDQ